MCISKENSACRFIATFMVNPAKRLFSSPLFMSPLANSILHQLLLGNTNSFTRQHAEQVMPGSSNFLASQVQRGPTTANSKLTSSSKETKSMKFFNASDTRIQRFWWKSKDYWRNHDIEWRNGKVPSQERDCRSRQWLLNSPFVHDPNITAKKRNRTT